LAFMLDCDIELDDVGDCTDGNKTMDFGMVIGVGVALEMPWPGSVTLDMRYEHGLVIIDDMAPIQDYKNRALLFSIGYSHRLGGGAR
jgi:hypothetical protein